LDKVHESAELSSSSILDTFHEDISQEKHEVIVSHGFCLKDSKNLGSFIRSFSSHCFFEHLGYIVSYSLDGERTELSTFDGRSVDLLVELMEVNDGLNNSRRSP